MSSFYKVKLLLLQSLQSLFFDWRAVPVKHSRLFSRPAALLAGCLLLSLLPGCGDHWRPHSRREVLSYVEEQFPGEQVTVAEDFANPLLDNGKPSSERVWDCCFTDLPDVVFHVRSRRLSASDVPILDYSLTNDRDRVFWDHYIEQYRAGADQLSLWNTATDGTLDFHFSSMADVPQAAEQLRTFYDWFESQPHAGQPRYATLGLDGLPLPAGYPIISRISLNTPSASISNPRATFHDPADMEELCAGMLKTYYAFYRLPCPDFSREELDSFARATWDSDWTEGESRTTVPRLSQDGRAVSVALFSGIGIIPQAGSGLQFSYLSYGGLFDVLVRLGLKPEGGPESFTVIGADGAFYEFSYRFTDTDGDESWWHYNRDGESIQCADADGIPILRIASDEFQAITGLAFQRPGT